MTASGAISVAARISSSTAGKVAAVVVMTAPSSYVQATVQTELDKTEQWIGRALTAASIDGDVIYALLSCIP